MITKQAYVLRRKEIANKIGKGAIALISASKEVLRNGDAHYPFRQNSDFYYCTGFQEPEAVLLILGGSVGESILFHRSRQPEAEQWTGPRLGPEAAPDVLGVTEAYAIEEFQTRFIHYLSEAKTIYYVMGQDTHYESLMLQDIRKIKQKNVRANHIAYELIDLGPILSEMRLFKSEAEIHLMRQAAQISVLAHQKAMQRCRFLEYEYELEAELRYVFTQQGCSGVAYEPIVACGKNACILHYSANRARLEREALVLIDAAGEYQNYAADITRTFPVSGQFSPEQRELYDLVLLAQQTAIRSVRPGLAFSDLQQQIVRILTQGLCDLGLLEGQLDGLIESHAYKAFYMHGSGHWLGLDVHDSGDYKKNNQPRRLEAGMVLTIEPGLYISSNHERVAPRWHNIGIRIEDDILVTSKGYENLTQSLIVGADDIEAWMSHA